MLFLAAFLIFVSLSVAAIPLSPNHQSPRSPLGLDSLKLESLPAAQLLKPAAGLLSLNKKKPVSGYSKKSVLGRFIMDADYASSSGPPTFFGKSPHRREDPLSNPLGSTPLRYNDVEEDITPQLSPLSTPT